MDRIQIIEEEYRPWGRVLALSDGTIDVKVTLDIGPRIIYLAPKGGENIMYEDIDGRITKGGEYFDKHFPEGRIWQIIGGHRLWKSPEDMATYYPDSDKVSCEVKDDSAIFVSEVERTTGLLKSLGIAMLGKGKIRVRHELFNTGKRAVRAALWALTVLSPGGTVVFPLNDNIEGFLPTRNYVLWPYTDTKDSRLALSDGHIGVSQSSDADKPFKLGAFLKKGVAAYIKGKAGFVKRFAADENSQYPDYGCNFEVYTDKNMIECESLSPLYNIGGGKSAVHYEEWSISVVEPKDTADFQTLCAKLFQGQK